jgi:hypothetical protein
MANRIWTGWKTQLLIVCIFLVGCGSSFKTKYQFQGSSYKLQKRQVFIHEAAEQETLLVTQIDSGGKRLLFTLPEFTDTVPAGLSHPFSQHSFDIDFLTIPFKYRPAVEPMQRQFNTNLNGAVYLGYRTDKYHVTYAQNPVGPAERKIRHFGFSVGAFAGFGATAINPWVTNNNVMQEYDGVVFNKGLALIMGINKVTLGFAFGFDNLLDDNSDFWVYQNKPWIGLAFGLNLN